MTKNERRLAFLAWNARRCEMWEPVYTGRSFQGGPWTPRRSSHEVWYKTFRACVDGAIKASGWKGKGKADHNDLSCTCKMCREVAR